MKKKYLAIVLALTMCMLGSAGCGKKSSVAEPGELKEPTEQSANAADLEVDSSLDVQSSKDTLTIAMPSDPGTIDMHYSTAYDYVAPFVVNHLLIQEYDANNMVLPAIGEESLALEYAFDENDMGLTFTLREGVKFSNGYDLTAEDVAFSIRLCSDQSYYTMVDFENIEANGNTVHVPLLSKDANALYNIGATIPIYSQKYYEELDNEAEFFSTGAVGTGPYKIAEWVGGDYLDLEANENYFAGAPIIKKLRIRFITDASVAYMELQNGGVDIVQQPNWTDVESVLAGNDSGITCWEESSAYMLQLGMNCSGALSDLKLRQAVVYAINKEELATGAFLGSGENSYCLVSESLPGTVDYKESWPYGYDPEKAKELLAEAGYQPGELSLTCIVGAGGGPRTDAAQMIGGDLETIGITLEIKEVDIATYASTITDQPETWDFWLRNFGSGIGNAPSAHDYFGQNVAMNCFIDKQDSSEKMLELADAMGQTMDDEERETVFAELQEYFLNECLYTCPLVQQKTYTLVNSSLKNLTKCGQLYWNVKNAYFE